MQFNPHPYQLDIVEWIQTHRRCAIFASMGSGKTVSTLTAIDDLSLVENIYPMLIIAPRNVAQTTWPQELAKWTHLQHLTVSVITGTIRMREKALFAKADIYTINYDNLPWLVETLGKNWKFSTVVVDESTRLKGFRLRQGTKRAKALAKVAHTIITRIILLTGTPAPNGLLDLWGQLWFIDMGKRLGNSFSRFTDRWFTTDYSGFNFEPVSSAQADIQAAIRDVCLTIDATKLGDITRPIVNKIYIDLPKPVAIQYKKMESEMFLQLESEGVEAVNTAVVGIKCSQIASGAIYLEDKTWQVLHDEKIHALESVREEAAGMPLLIAYRFKSDLTRLRNAFPTGQAMDDNDSTITDWNAGKIPFLFVHPASAGHGLNLQHGSNILVFFSLSWNLEEHLQVIERIGPLRQKQAGYTRPVFIHYMIARDTIDETILERLETKKTIQDTLLAALRKHKGGMT